MGLLNFLTPDNVSKTMSLFGLDKETNPEKIMVRGSFVKTLLEYIDHFVAISSKNPDKLELYEALSFIQSGLLQFKGTKASNLIEGVRSNFESMLRYESSSDAFAEAANELLVNRAGLRGMYGYLCAASKKGEGNFKILAYSKGAKQPRHRSKRRTQPPSEPKLG